MGAERTGRSRAIRASSDASAGIPRAGLRAALRRALEEPSPSSPATPAGDSLTIYEEQFGEEFGGFPQELFGPDFRWDIRPRGRLAFLDIETCGLADEPIFLIGILQPQESRLRLRRLFARDPSGEPALIRKAAGILGGSPVWITFNGRSFDGPRLRRRAHIHEIDLALPEEHLDLLHAVRRRWRQELPNCRLSTVERRLLGLDRGPGDVPGREVPERYWDYVRGGDFRWIEPVLEHNRRDVTAMTVLYRRLQEE